MRRIGIVMFFLCIVACSDERRAKHEQLAKSLEAPMALLCKTTQKEGSAAIEGKAVRDAADAFAALPPFGDAETEALLAELRKSARALKGAFGDACKEADAACADARKQASFNVSDLGSVATRVSGTTEARTGVKMPSPTPEGCSKLAR
jgi:hypothetical protein